MSQLQKHTLSDGTTFNVFWLSIEGLIGAGKSELLKVIVARLEEKHGKKFVMCVPENVESLMETGLFQKFNNDPKKYAYQFQTMFFHTRTRSFLDAWEEKVLSLLFSPSRDVQGKTLYIVSERSIISDTLFMRVHHQLGNVDEGDLKNYMSLNSMWRNIYPVRPSSILYCRPGLSRDESLDICDVRIDERARESEKKLVTKEYNGWVYDAHQSSFGGTVCPVDMGNRTQEWMVPVIQFDTKANYRDDADVSLNASSDILNQIENLLAVE